MIEAVEPRPCLNCGFRFVCFVLFSFGGRVIVILCAFVVCSVLLCVVVVVVCISSNVSPYFSQGAVTTEYEEQKTGHRSHA